MSWRTARTRRTPPLTLWEPDGTAVGVYRVEARYSACVDGTGRRDLLRPGRQAGSLGKHMRTTSARVRGVLMGAAGWVVAVVLAVVCAWLVRRDRRSRRELERNLAGIEARAYARGVARAQGEAARRSQVAPPLPDGVTDRQAPPIYVPPPVPWHGDRWGRNEGGTGPAE